MKEITLHNLFYGFSDKINEALRLEDSLIKANEQVKSFKEQIINEPKLHEILTTVGIIHDKKLYKKLERPSATDPDVASYYFDIQDYIEPVNSFQLDEKLGDNNE